MKNWIFVITLCISVLACGGNTALRESVSGTTAPEAQQKEPTQAPAPTEAIADTPTPEAPTQTPVPPKPIDFSGSGDKVVDVNKADGPMIAHIKGNAANSFFSVTSLDANNQTLDLLANTIAVYDGVRPVDFRDGQKTTRFEVKATGDWEIHLLPVTAADKLNVPGEIKGTGDKVIVLTGAKPDKANISGNASKSFFAVTGYGGMFPDLLVNSVDVYKGESLVNPETVVLVVQATDDWSISVTGK